MLKENNSRIYDLLKSNPDKLSIVADEIAHLFKLRKKFQDFMIHFKPGPPENRPSEEYRINYTNGKLKQSLYKIYDYRSKALHNGIGFPEPMCRHPQHDSKGIYEKPLKNGQATGHPEFSFWNAKDVPMYLNTFEYLVRNALKKWWKSLIKT